MDGLTQMHSQVAHDIFVHEGGDTVIRDDAVHVFGNLRPASCRLVLRRPCLFNARFKLLNTDFFQVLHEEGRGLSCVLPAGSGTLAACIRAICPGGLRGPTSALDLAKRLVAVGQMLWKSFLFLSALEQLQRAFGPDPVEVIVKVLPDTVGVHASSVFIIGAEHGRQGGGMRLELRGSVVKRGEDDGLSTRNRRAPHARLSQLARSRGGTSSAAGVRK